MSVVQTTYPNYHEDFVDGQIADTSTCDVDSYFLADADPVPFGRVVRAHTGDRGCILGPGRTSIAMLSAALNNSATSASVDNIRGTEMPAGIHIAIDNEIMYVSGVAGGTLTIVRGALNSTAAAHTNNTRVNPLNEISMLGIAIQDQRLGASSGVTYMQGDPVSVLWRGDVAVRVSAAVEASDSGGDVVVASNASGAGTTLETRGQLSTKAVASNHLLIPNARFISSADAQGIAVVRLSGPN